MTARVTLTILHWFLFLLSSYFTLICSCLIVLCQLLLLPTVTETLWNEKLTESREPIYHLSNGKCRRKVCARYFIWVVRRIYSWHYFWFNRWKFRSRMKIQMMGKCLLWQTFFCCCRQKLMEQLPRWKQKDGKIMSTSEHAPFWTTVADLRWRDKIYCKIAGTIDYPPRRIWRSDASSFCAQIILWIQETARFANRTRAERDGTKDFQVIIPDPANPKESARRIALVAMPRMRSLN